MPRFRMRNIKALFNLNIEKMYFFKIRSKCITFVGIDHILIYVTPHNKMHNFLNEAKRGGMYIKIAKRNLKVSLQINCSI